jgi:hypothetical protein
LPTYLTRPPLRFTQSHYLTDVRLALGYTAVIIAGALFYFDYKHGWEHSKPYTAPAVGIYFILNTLFTFWIWKVERGTVFVGTSTGGKGGKGAGAQLRIESSTKKHDPTYRLKVTVTENGRENVKEIQAPFSRWFTSDGVFVAKPFQQWLASEVSLVGDADPENIVEEIGRGSGAGEGIVSGMDRETLGSGVGGKQQRRRKG